MMLYLKQNYMSKITCFPLQVNSVTQFQFPNEIWHFQILLALNGNMQCSLVAQAFIFHFKMYLLAFILFRKMYVLQYSLRVLQTILPSIFFCWFLSLCTDIGSLKSHHLQICKLTWNLLKLCKLSDVSYVFRRPTSNIKDQIFFITAKHLGWNIWDLLLRQTYIAKHRHTCTTDIHR